MWNELPEIKKARSVSPDRKTAIRCQLREITKKSEWKEIFSAIESNPQLISKPWFTFDFMFQNKTNFLKVKNGNYDFMKKSKVENGLHDPDQIIKLTKDNPSYKVRNEFIHRRQNNG